MAWSDGSPMRFGGCSPPACLGGRDRNSLEFPCEFFCSQIPRNRPWFGLAIGRRNVETPGRRRGHSALTSTTSSEIWTLLYTAIWEIVKDDGIESCCLPAPGYSPFPCSPGQDPGPGPARLGRLAPRSPLLILKFGRVSGKNKGTRQIRGLSDTPYVNICHLPQALSYQFTRFRSS